MGFRRQGIGRPLIHDPDLLILDEPTTALEHPPSNLLYGLHFGN